MQRISVSAPPRRISAYGVKQLQNNESQLPFPSVSLKQNTAQFTARAGTGKCYTSKRLQKSTVSAANNTRRQSQQTNACGASKEESVKPLDILNMLDSVTRNMEHETLKGSPSSRKISRPYSCMTIQDLSKSQSRCAVNIFYQDWRGVITQEPLNIKSKSQLKNSAGQTDGMVCRRDILRNNKQAVESSFHKTSSAVEDHRSQKPIRTLNTILRNVRNIQNNKSTPAESHTRPPVDEKNIVFSWKSSEPAFVGSRNKKDTYVTSANDRIDPISPKSDKRSKLSPTNHDKSEKGNAYDPLIVNADVLQSSSQAKETNSLPLELTKKVLLEEDENKKVLQQDGHQACYDTGFENKENASSLTIQQKDTTCLDQLTQKIHPNPSTKPERRDGDTERQIDTNGTGFRMSRWQKTQCKVTHVNKKKHMREWILFLNANKYVQESARKEKTQGVQKRLQHANTKSAGKRSKIGPHLEVYEAFHQRKKEPSSRIFANAAITIQKWIRRWLECTKLKRLRAKAECHGPSFTAVVKEYRTMMNNIQSHLGVKKKSIPLQYTELEEWLDRKTMYENMFSKREFWKEIDKSQLSVFFRDCGHFPSRQHIEDACGLFNPRLYGKEADVFKKHQVVEMAFTLYPPLGARLNNQTLRRSTWIHPIVNGKEGYKYLVAGHAILEKADIRVVGELVAKSIKERKEKLLLIPRPDF
ncbi:IQ domain-containing protein M [Ambystoma mexicanum]|uniref:IQ domain-containing protein M n=1 Tax=Ambystoma mexicanum TaxID=8296 RepID=UPI0037E91046